MSNVKRFFSLSDWGYDYDFQEFSSEEEARDSIQATADAARAWPDGTEWYDRLVWGEIRGVAREDGQLIPAPPTPDPETERLRAELADLRERLHEFVLDLSQSAENYRVQYMLTHAEMMDDAADRLVDLLEAKPADERVGGEK